MPVTAVRIKDVTNQAEGEYYNWDEGLGWDNLPQCEVGGPLYIAFELYNTSTVPVYLQMEQDGTPFAGGLLELVSAMAHGNLEFNGVMPTDPANIKVVAYFAENGDYGEIAGAEAGSLSFTITPLGVTPPPQCTIDSDCPTGYVCVSGECVEIQTPPGFDLIQWIKDNPLIFAGGLALGGVVVYKLTK